MKKLWLDSGTKTAFSYGNAIYQQCDRESMGSPVLAKITLTELKKKLWCLSRKVESKNFIGDMSMICWY